jgi:macrolide transport system ATP-binding/permease protein
MTEVARPVIEVEKLVKVYRPGDTDVVALDGVSLRIEAGEYVAVMGPSGSGKSTLLQILGLLDRPTSGRYLLEGREAYALSDGELSRLRGSRVGFVFQLFNLLPRATALRNVELPMAYQGQPAEVRRERARRALGELGLEGRASYLPRQLSGGEQQRVAIARAVAHVPALVLADEPTGNLSTAQASDVLDRLERMNEKGITIVIVTHDPEVARRAGRLIRLRDGRIESDERKSSATARASPLPDPPSRESASSLRRAARDAGMAFASLSSNRLRTGLASLGVVIGVAAVVAMAAVGAGAREQARERIASLGANLLLVVPQAADSQPLGARLTLEDAAAIEALRAEGVGIARVIPAVSRSGVPIEFEGRVRKTLVVGTSPGYPAIHDARPDWGRFFTKDDDQRLEKVCVLGPTVARALFPGGRDPVGETVRIAKLYFTVVGVLPPKGGSSLGDLDDRVLVPVQTAMNKLFGARHLGYIEVQLDSADEGPAAALRLEELLRSLHRVPDDRGDAFTIRTMADVQRSLSGVAETLSVLLAVVAAISMIVGGIGIMNIMLVSVRERTREIGLRRAMGASRGDVLFQFLVESALIALTGGLAGSAAGVAASFELARFAGWRLIVTPDSVALAFGFSAVVGLVFGSWPAFEAARLSPAEALRYE